MGGESLAEAPAPAKPTGPPPVNLPEAKTTTTEVAIDKNILPPQENKPDKNEYGTIAINTVIRNLYNEEEALNLEEVPLSKLVQMIHNDGSAAGLLNIIKLPIVASGFRIDEFDGKSITEAAFVEQQLKFPPALGGMTTTMRYIIADMCMAVVTGFRVYEKCWGERNGKYVLEKLAPRNPLTVRIKQDKNGGFNGFSQYVMTGSYFSSIGATALNLQGSPISIKKDKALLFTRNKEENPLYGRSDFLPAYYHYDKIHKLYYIAHIAFQLDAIPPRIGTFPRGADKADKDRFFSQLSKLGFDTSLMMPEGYTVTEFGVQRAGRDQKGLIEHHKTEMWTAMLAQFANLGQSGASHGSFAATKTFSGIFLMALEALNADIDETFNNHVIPQMIDYNFDSRKYPRLTHNPLDTAKQEAIQNIFMKIMSSPADHASPEFILAAEEQLAKDFDFDIDYDAIRAQRLAQLVKNQIQQGQIQSGAIQKLADTLLYDSETGNVTATTKTYDVLKELVADVQSQTETYLRNHGLDPNKLSEDDSKAAEDPPKPQTPTAIHLYLGDAIQKANEGNQEAVTKLADAVTALATAEAGREIVITMPEQKAAQVIIPEGAIKVEVHPEVKFEEGSIRVDNTTKQEEKKSTTKTLHLKRSEDGTETTITSNEKEQE